MYRVYPSADASMAVVAGPVPELDEAMVLFSGPHAHVMAKEFAAWKNAQTKSAVRRSGSGDEGPKRFAGAAAPRQSSRDPSRIPWKSTTAPARPVRPGPRNGA